MLAVNEEFVSFQGEGVNAGIKMYFIRLQGCSVGCYFCDTKQTWREEDATTTEESIAERAEESNCEWVCITGGEPLEQDLTKLVHLLHGLGIKIALETSGMFYHEIIRNIDHITLSPKNLFAKKDLKLKPKFVQLANELKCVVTSDKDADFYLDFFNVARWVKNPRKFLQPVDNNPEIAKMLLTKDLGTWRVTGQQQKLLQLR